MVKKLPQSIECFMLDHVMNMRRESVQFMIFSWKHEEIANAIVEETEHALTIPNGIDATTLYTSLRKAKYRSCYF